MRVHHRALAFCAVFVIAGSSVATASEIRLLGAINGQVRSAAGVSQIGATVMLLNRNDRVISRTLTNIDGKFQFDSLVPDRYSVKVLHNSFLPAALSNILVKAGLESRLNVQLANIFSSIELIYAPPGEDMLMSDEWKWVLRSSSATRPVLRIRPQIDAVPTPLDKAMHSMFAATRGVVRVSAGDSGGSTALGNEPDLGTAFALATSLFGTRELHFAGNVGYATSVGSPTAGFSTRYRDGGLAPDVELTVRQVGVRHRAGQGLIGGPNQDSPTLRTMSVKVADRAQLTDDMSLDYGFLMESVAFLDRVHQFSPFARLSYDRGKMGVFEFGYSNGAAPLDLLETAGANAAAANPELSSLSMFPRVSLRGGQARVQRSENFEIGYRKRIKSRTYAAAVYREQVRDAAVTMALPPGEFSSADILPDIASNSSIFNVGSYGGFGYLASLNQSLGENWSVTGSFGAGNALQPNLEAPSAETASEFRSRFQTTRQRWASARVNGTLPLSGTRVSAAYVWAPEGAFLASHSFLTQRNTPQLGMNIQVRQPLPAISGMPGRIEANAEFRNLLENGYMKLPASANRQLLLIQFPRSVRGGFSFIF